MSSSNSVGSTAINATLWVVGAFLALKLLPGVIKGFAAGSSGSGGGQTPVNQYTAPYLFTGRRGYDTDAFAAGQLANNGSNYFGSPISQNNPAAAQIAQDIVTLQQPVPSPAYDTSGLPQFDAEALTQTPASDLLSFSAGNSPFATAPTSVDDYEDLGDDADSYFGDE